jgi:xanthine dehydrogenase YagS FAD-binding subunit
MKSFAWLEARSMDQALLALAPRGGGATVLKGGGVDLLDQMKEGLISPARLINLRRIPDLAHISLAAAPTGQRLVIGPAVTLAQLAIDPLVLAHVPLLAACARAIATPQIRAVATVGGNLLQRPQCWYLRSALHPCKRKGGLACFAMDGENEGHAIFDNQVCAAVHPSSLAIALCALQAEVEVRSVSAGAQSTRRLLALALSVSPSEPQWDLRRDHRLNPTELLTEVSIPIVPKQRGAYLRLKQKQSFDWPMVEVAVALSRAESGEIRAARVVLGAVAPTPHHNPAVDAALIGSKGDDAALSRCAELAQKGARPLLHNQYKVALVKVAIQRALRMALS